MIISRQNKTVKSVAALKDKKARRERGEYLIEGEKAVREAVARKLDIGVILATPEYFAEFGSSSFEVLEVSEDIIDYCADERTPQGVVATLRIPKKGMKKPSGVCVIMDGVKDPGNVGTVIRTCAALNVRDIYLVNCADAFSPKCVRSTMSGIFSVNLYNVGEDEKEALFDSANIVVADMGGENIFDVEKVGDFCLVIGSESHGVSEFFRSRAKKTVAIPMSPNMESLNAAIAGSIILYQLLKKPI